MKLYEIYGVNVRLDADTQCEYQEKTLITRAINSDYDMYEIVRSDYSSETSSEGEYILRHKYDYFKSVKVEIPAFAVVYIDAAGNPATELCSNKEEAALRMYHLTKEGNRLLVPEAMEV